MKSSRRPTVNQLQTRTTSRARGVADSHCGAQYGAPRGTGRFLLDHCCCDGARASTAAPTTSTARVFINCCMTLAIHSAWDPTHCECCFVLLHASRCSLFSRTSVEGASPLSTPPVPPALCTGHLVPGLVMTLVEAQRRHHQVRVSRGTCAAGRQESPLCFRDTRRHLLAHPRGRFRIA
jgi:hypothetical protein